MNSREANIEQLDSAITSLNEDAEDIHELIARSTTELENAVAAGNRAADSAEQVAKVLDPLTELLEKRYRDSNEMLAEARSASEEQRTAAAKQVEALEDAVKVSLEYVGTSTDEARLELKKTVDNSMTEISRAQVEAFDDIKSKTMKEHERTRDELQTDILGFKNATSARLDSLEAEVTKAQNAIKELEGRITESADAVSKKLFVPICAAIGLGAIDLICLVMLLMR